MGDQKPWGRAQARARARFGGAGGTSGCGSRSCGSRGLLHNKVCECSCPLGWYMSSAQASGGEGRPSGEGPAVARMEEKCMRAAKLGLKAGHKSFRLQPGQAGETPPLMCPATPSACDHSARLEGRCRSHPLDLFIVGVCRAFRTILCDPLGVPALRKP